MAVVDAPAAVPGEDRVELAQVRPELLGRDGGVLPAGPCLAAVGLRVTMPAPSSRIRHSAFMRAGSLDDRRGRVRRIAAATARAAASASARVAPPVST